MLENVPLQLTPGVGFFHMGSANPHLRVVRLDIDYRCLNSSGKSCQIDYLCPYTSTLYSRTSPYGTKPSPYE